MKISVIGLGRVGLPFAVFLAHKGFQVTGLDINEKLVQKISTGKAPFFEPNLEKLLKKTIEQKTFQPTTDYAQTADSDIFLITVWTPVEKAEPDLTSLEKVFSQLEKHFKPEQLFIIKSTVPVGTSRKFLEQLEKKWNKKCGKDFYFAFVPERMVEGKALEEIEKITKIIGSKDEQSEKKAKEFFKKIGGKIATVDLETAEFVKILDNAYRYTNIAIGNQIFFWCNSLGLDARKVISVANEGYERNNIFLPGPAGGPCLGKDTKMLKYCVEKTGFNPKLVDIVLETNSKMNDFIVNMAEEKLGSLKNKKILVFGVAFKGKPQNDDIKNSPAIPIISELKQKGATVYAFDSLVSQKDIEKIGAIKTDSNNTDVDLALVLNNNPDFEKIDFSGFKQVIDCWNVVKKKPQNYTCLGI